MSEKMSPLNGRERISFEEAAERLDITKRCLFMWVAAKKFPRPCKFARRTFYFEDEFQEAIDARMAAELEKS